jgi:hypothetical protein
MSRRIAVRRGAWLVLVLAGVICAAPCQSLRAAQGVFGKMLGKKGDVTYRVYRDPNGRFSIEYPNKDWRIVPSGQSALVILAREDGEATLVVDATTLVEALSPAEIAAMVDVEVTSLKDRLPNATEIKAEVVEIKSGRAALIHYASAGARGPEKSTQYSIPVDKQLFRLIGVTPATAAAKYDAILAHMVESFKVPAEPATTKD